MKRGTEFKLIYDAREALIKSQSMQVKLMKEADTWEAKEPLVDLFLETLTATENLSKIIDAVDAKRYDW